MPVAVRAVALVCAVALAALPCDGAAPPSGSGFTVNYFAYGSNLAAAVREGRRGLSPISQTPGVVRDYKLAFNVRGFSAREPAFASIAAAPGDECHGGVYELSLRDWATVCATEGVPFAYRVVQVEVEPYAGGEAVQAWTLDAQVPSFFGEAPPSERYLTLIRDGAKELGLTTNWQERLAKVKVAPGGSPTVERAAQFEKRKDATFV